jgi:hypothetical protein
MGLIINAMKHHKISRKCPDLHGLPAQNWIVSLLYAHTREAVLGYGQ